jgi:hypothetical protein
VIECAQNLKARRLAGCPSALAEGAEDAPYLPNDEAAAAVGFQS